MKLRLPIPLAAISSVSYAATSGATISINFDKGRGEATSTSGLIDSEYWNQMEGAVLTTPTAMFNSLNVQTDINLSFTSKNTWGVDKTDPLLKGYLDDGTDGTGTSKGPQVQLTNLNTQFLVYDLYIYASTDTGGAKFSAKEVNGVLYSMDGDKTIVGGGIWGDTNTNAERPVLGGNAIHISGLSDDVLDIYGGRNTGGGRGCIAGMQIVAYQGKVFQGSFTSGTANWGDAIWTLDDASGQTWSDSTESARSIAYISGTAADGTTLSLGGNTVTTDGIILKGGQLTLDNGSLTWTDYAQGRLDISQGTSLTINENVTVSGTVNPRVDGTLTYNASSALGSVTINNGGILNYNSEAVLNSCAINAGATLNFNSGSITNAIVLGPGAELNYNGGSITGNISGNANLRLNNEVVFNQNQAILTGAPLHISSSTERTWSYETLTFNGNSGIGVGEGMTINVTKNFGTEGGSVVSIVTGTLAIEGGAFSAQRLITSDYAWATSILQISSGLLDITGTGDGSHKAAVYAVRLGHWSYDSVTRFDMSGGEFRVVNGAVRTGDDGYTIWNMTGGTANMMGLRAAGASTSITMSGADTRMNIGEYGISEGGNRILLKGGTIGVLDEGWTLDASTSLRMAGDVTFDTQATYNRQTDTFEAGGGKTVTLNGILSQEPEGEGISAGKLIKTGSGTLILNGKNTYTGGTEVLGGTLNVLSGSISGPIKLGTGVTLGYFGSLDSLQTSLTTDSGTGNTLALKCFSYFLDGATSYFGTPETFSSHFSAGQLVWDSRMSDGEYVLGGGLNQVTIVDAGFAPVGGGTGVLTDGSSLSPDKYGTLSLNGNTLTWALNQAALENDGMSIISWKDSSWLAQGAPGFAALAGTGGTVDGDWALCAQGDEKFYYLNGANAAAVITGSGDTPAYLVGGMLAAGDDKTATVQKNVWLDVRGGNFKGIFGANMNQWSEYNRAFVGDTHLQLIGDTTSNLVMGMGPAYAASMTGDSYIYIGENAQILNGASGYPSTMDGNVYGGGYSPDNVSVNFTGDTHITIANVQTTAGNVFGGSTMKNTASALIHGGSTYITVDLEAGQSGIFAKNIYGGSHIGAEGGGSPNLTINGDGNVSVTAPADVTFSGVIAGGGLISGGGSANAQVNVLGDTHVTIDGGTYNNLVIGGGHKSGGNGTVSVGGNTNVTIKSGTFRNVIYGGGSGAGATVAGNTNIVVTGISSSSRIFGGGNLISVGGNTSVSVSGSADKRLIIVGGSQLASGATDVGVAGNTNVVFGETYGAGADLDAVDAANQAMRIFGAGLYGVVSGDSTVTFKSGTLVGELDGSGVPLTGVGADLAGGGWAGGVTGNTTLNLEGGTIDMNEARLIVGGSAEHDRGVGGSTHIFIGKDLLVKHNNAIYGGNYGNGTIGAGTNVTISDVAAGDRFYDYTGTIYGGSAGTGAVTGDKVLNLDNVSALLAKFSGFDTMNVKGGAGTTSVVSLGSSTVNVVTSGRILSVALASDESIASLSGAGSLLLTGGALTVTGASDSTGSITVQGTGSVLKAQGASSVGKGSVMLSNGGTLLFSSTAFDAMEAASKITIGGTDAASSKGTLRWDGTGNDKDISGLLDIAADKELTLDTNGNEVTLSGIISSGNFVKTGAGTLTMSGASTYAGTTTVSDGTLKAGHVSGFGTGTVVLAGGTLDLDGKAAANGVTVSGTAVLNGGSAYAGVLTLDGGTLTGDAVNLAEGKTAQLKSGSIANVLSGDGGIEKSGEGTVVLTGENTYAGTTTVSGGTLKAGGLKAFSGSTVTLSGGTLDLDNLAIENALSVTGETTVAGGSAYAGTLKMDGGTLKGDALHLKEGTTALLSSGTIESVLSGGGAVTKTGNGTVVIKTQPTYTGLTTVSGGMLKFDDTALASPRLGNITMSGTGVLSSTNLTLTGNSVLTMNMAGRETGDASFVSLSGTFTNESTADKNLVLSGYQDLTPGTYQLFTGNDLLSLGDFKYVLSDTSTRGFLMDMVDNTVVLRVSTIVSWTWKGQAGDTNAVWKGVNESPGEVWDADESESLQYGPDNQVLWFVSTSQSHDFNHTVTIVGDVTPKSVTVSNESGDANSFVFAGDSDANITGTAILTKQGGGQLTIETHNTYEGGTRLEGGTVVVTNDDALGSGLITFRANETTSGGTLLAKGDVTLDNRLSAEGVSFSVGTVAAEDRLTLTQGEDIKDASISVEGAGTVALAGINHTSVLTGTVSVDEDSTLALSNTGADQEIAIGGRLSGILGTVEKNDGGSLLLKLQNGDDTFSGKFSMADGWLVMSGYKPDGISDVTLLTTNDIDVANLRLTASATLKIGSADSEGSVRVKDSLELGTEGFSGALILDKGTLDAADATAILGQNGSGQLTINGGEAALSGIQFGSEDSALTVHGGKLVLGASGITGTPGTVTLGNGVLSAATSWSSDHTLVLAGTADKGGSTVDVGQGLSISLSGALSGSGVMTKSGAGSLVLSGTNEGDTQWDGTLTVTEGVVELSSSSALAKGGLVVDGDSASADLGGLGIANAITIKNGSLTRASGYVSDSNVSILAHEGVAGIDLGGLKASAIASILVPVKTDISPYRATTISGIGSGNLTLEGPTTLMLGENNYVPGSSGRADGVIVFGSDAGASAAGHDVSLGSLTLGLTLDLQKSISRNNLEGTTVLLQLTNGRLVADAPQTHSATFNGYSDLSEGSLAWLKSIRFNPLLQYLGYAVKTVDISQAQFDSYLSDGQVAITAGGDVYFASDDKGQLNAGTHYNYLDAYKAVVIDEDLDISLSGAPAAGSGHPAGLKVENLLGGLGEDGTVYTITVANADPGSGAAKINFVNGLNTEGEKLDTVYDGNIAGGSADFIKTGAAGLTINGSFSTSGTVTTSEGTLTLNGTSSFGTLDTGREGAMTVIGGTGKTESLKGSGALSLSGEASRLTLTGAGNTVLDTQVTGSGTLDMAGGTLLVGTGSLSSDTTLNLQEHAGLYIGGGETIEMGYLTGPGTVDFQGVDAAPAVLKLTGNGEGTISFAMEGRGTLAKAGTGTQTLAMSNDSLSLDVQGGRLVVDLPSGTASYGHLAVNDGAELVLKNNAKSSGLLVHGGGSLVLGTSDPASTVGHMKLDISGNAAFGEGSLLTTVAAPGIDNTSGSATGTVTLPERMSLRFINHDSEGWNAPLSDLVVMDATGGFLNVSGQTLGSGTDFTDWTVTFEKSISLFYTSADLSIGHDGRQLLATPVLNKVNTLDQYAGSETAKAGAGLIWNAGLQKSGSNLDLLLSSIMDDIKTGSASSASHKMAAAAGSTVTSLLGAQQADYRYQQTLLRNRMTTMGLPEGYNYDGELPLWNAWVQATGTYNSLTESGDFAGYKYNTWGGTFGVDTNLSERLTVGLAMSASYGKLTSNGADTLSGDLDIYYANLFARYQKGKWGHNFIVTAGWSDGTVDRTVNYGEGSYTGHGSTSGSTYGAMYEATYDIALNEENNAIFQPLVNVSVMRNEVDDYNETGAGNAGLRVSGLEGTSATVSVGGRLMGIIGGNVFGRESLGELRVQVAQDLGDTRSEGNVGFLSNPGFSRQVKGSKAGTTGLQFGAGLSLPSGENGTIFVDATADIRSRMTSASGSIGYRYNF